MDIILFQRISGGWEFQYTSDGQIYRGIDPDPAITKVKLLRQLGWFERRVERAVLRRF